MMVTAVFDYLVRHPEMRLLGVIDREDIVAAPRFLVCRDDALELYKYDLLNAFSRFHFSLDTDMETYSVCKRHSIERLIGKNAGAIDEDVAAAEAFGDFVRKRLDRIF
jgi:hypothetical protein